MSLERDLEIDGFQLYLGVNEEVCKGGHTSMDFNVAKGIYRETCKKVSGAIMGGLWFVIYQAWDHSP